MKSIRNRSERGDVHIVAIAMITIALFGLVGFLFWNNVMQPNEQAKPIATTSPSSTASVNPTANPSANKLTIADWKIEFTIPNTLKDTSVKYFARKSNDSPPVMYYSFTTSRIQDLGGQCAAQTFGDTVILNRFSEDQPAYPDSYWVSSDKIGDYRYVLSGPIASCSSVDENGQVIKDTSQIELKDKDALKELVESIKSTE